MTVKIYFGNHCIHMEVTVVHVQWLPMCTTVINVYNWYVVSLIIYIPQNIIHIVLYAPFKIILLWGRAAAHLDLLQLK